MKIYEQNYTTMRSPSVNAMGRLWRSQNTFRRVLIVLCLLVASSLTIASGRSTLRNTSRLRYWSEELLAGPKINTLETTTSKYAYATFYVEDAEKEESDRYLICTRMLNYQLLHDPATRTNSSIPFVVLVPPSVSLSKRARLQSEGATVVEIPAMNFTWMKPGRERWAHVMDKLNVYRLTQFEKVLLLDSDIVIFKPLDAIFESPETEIRTNLGNSSNTKDDEGVQPRRYLMAGDSAPENGDKHEWPAPRTPGPCNAGFVVIHPSEEMYEHNLRIASIEGRFSGTAPEQNLWNYIHRPDGNMPWTRLKDMWVMNSPTYSDYTNGIAAVHEKWFRNSHNDMELKQVLQRSRWRMEGFWAGGPLQES